MSVSSFAGFLCYAIIQVLPYVVVVRILDIVLYSLQSGMFKGKLVFRGSDLNE